MFGDTEIEIQRLHCYKKTIFIDEVDIIKIVVSNKVSLSKEGFKYLIG